MNIKRRQRLPREITKGRLPIMGKKYSNLGKCLSTYKNSAVYDQQRIQPIKVSCKSLYKTLSIFLDLKGSYNMDKSYIQQIASTNLSYSYMLDDVHPSIGAYIYIYRYNLYVGTLYFPSKTRYNTDLELPLLSLSHDFLRNKQMRGMRYRSVGKYSREGQIPLKIA